MNTISAQLARFGQGMRFADLPPESVSQTKKLVLDFVGVSLAGLKTMALPRRLAEYFVELGGKPEATVFGAKQKLPAVNAAFVNAACGHALDMDDGHRFAALHPGTVVIPAALAAAELHHATTRQLIAGITVGYEVMIRVGMAINPSSLNRGFHATGITGPFGAAAAAANIFGLDVESAEAALGLAGLGGAGLLQVNHESEGSQAKPLTPARAAMSGLLSAVLASRGTKAPQQIFEGSDGFLKAFSDKVDVERLTHGLGEDLEINRAYIKFYSACRHAHPAVDAALEAKREARMEAERIRSVRIETYPAVLRLAGIPHATSVSGARFSTSFSVALALVRGKAGASEYCDENVRDQEIQGLASRIEIVASERWEKLYPQKRGATVTLFDEDGQSHLAEVELAKGEPENPASMEEVYEKFRRNAGLCLPCEETESLGRVITRLELIELDELTGLLLAGGGLAEERI
ncbi:MAG: MmgE/PrpD family protein [Myxococcota bacterium]|jgi:2-methylcitrate dehydratase PrpD|nr:MmgE/PrpD family protein [Myxococcota bacterium]